MTPQEMIDVIQAYKDGKQIEQRANVPSADWHPSKYPSWNFASFIYRIAPKQTKELYKFLLYNKDNQTYKCSANFYTNLAEAHKVCDSPIYNVCKRLDYTKITIKE